MGVMGLDVASTDGNKGKQVRKEWAGDVRLEMRGSVKLCILSKGKGILIIPLLPPLTTLASYC